MTAHASPQQIMDAFARLTERDKRALFALAAKYLGGTRFSEPLDLVYEALYLAVEGKRRWPLDVEFPIFLTMTARSVAFADRTLNETVRTTAMPSEEVLWLADQGDSFHPSAEACVERDRRCRHLWSAVASARGSLSSRDAVAADVLDLLVAEESPSDIRGRLGLRAAEFDAAKKRALREVRNRARL